MQLTIKDSLLFVYNNQSQDKNNIKLWCWHIHIFQITKELRHISDALGYWPACISNKLAIQNKWIFKKQNTLYKSE